jgi:TPR repeat protein
MGEPWYRRFLPRTHAGHAARTLARADAGDRDAQYALGMTYVCSTGPLQDMAGALVWLRRAAEQNHALAQFNLGTMYAEGHGVDPDQAQALVWMRRAAAQGDAGAQFNLGVRSQRASYAGAKPEASEARIEAYKWFELASRQGYGTAAASCESMNLGMSREEVEEGDRRVASAAALENVPVS